MICGAVLLFYLSVSFGFNSPLFLCCSRSVSLACGAMLFCLY